MKWRWFAIVIWYALSLRLLTACAKMPTLPDGVAIGKLAQLVIPGAIRSDVKDLALDSARARGWSIIKSTGDILVMQRSLAPSSASAQALGGTPSTTPPVIEVTSAFVEHSDGVTVALGATLITQPPGETSPKRVDCTDNYRGALTQSLQSLRANWMAGRQRVGDAIPTQTADSPPPRAATSRTDTITPTSGQPTDGAAAKQAMAGDRKSPAPARAPAAPRIANPTPRPADLDQAAATLHVAPEFRPSPLQEPPVRSIAPSVPVVDGSNAPAGASDAATHGPAGGATPPQPAPESIAPKDSMLSLTQSSRTGVWAYYAEQYARLRGCDLTDAGAELIESRADGEIHKVFCTGSESYLLKCQGGVCRGLR